MAFTNRWWLDLNPWPPVLEATALLTVPEPLPNIVVTHLVDLNCKLVWNQCDQMAVLFFKIRPWTTFKCCPKHYNFVKVGSKVCQTLNKPSTIWQRLKNVAKVAKFRQICQDVNNLFFQSLVHIHLKILEESLTDDDLADFCSVLSKNLDKVLHWMIDWLSLSI